MTPDDFTEAARAEGQARIAAMLETAGASADIRAWFPAGFEKGAEWARTHLAAQEPTDAEVEAAALEEGTLAVLRDGGLPFDRYDEVRDLLAGTRETRPEAWAEGLHIARRILTAARAARRDEEKR